MTNEKWLLIDDMRTFGVDKICRTAKEGMIELATEQYTALILDHDLGELVTGYDILLWALENKCLPKLVQLVSMNPPGLRAMKERLLEAGYVDNNGTFILKG